MIFYILILFLVEVSVVPCVVSACINQHVDPVIWQEALGLLPLDDKDLELSDLAAFAPKEVPALLQS